MASETGNKYRGEEGTIQSNLEALLEIIVDRVDYQHLIESLPYDMLSFVQQKEIHNIKQKDGPAAATKRILEIVKVSKKPGKYQALVDALQRDYLILSKGLTGHPLPDDSIQKNIIQVFSSNITERMSTIQLLPYLIRSSVIVQLEKEMVEAELRNYGNIRGAQLLLLYLPAHVENWYTEFLKALCDSGQKDLAEFIDESFTLKFITSSNTGVMKTDADAQLYLSRKEDGSDTDLSDDEIPKEVRIKEEKEEDETERKEMSLENTAYDSDEKEEVEIPLRKYQEELARLALLGKNVIIMAPTIVAFKLIQNHFHRPRYKYTKVVLLVKDQALADQHGKTCQELLPKYSSQAINGDIKRDKGISLGDCIEKQDILVVTAQLLLNSLMDGEIKSITQFSLLIFDECHHCHDDHAYNKIMQLYRDIKLTPEADTSSLPQIIGLTASIGVGKANGILQAKEHIKKIMANMDAELISTVKDNLDELYQHVPMTSSGLARAMDSRYHVVAQEGKGTAQKEEINMMQEELVQKAVNELKTDIQQDPQGFTKILRQIQDQEKLEHEAKQKENHLAEGEYDLRCVACDHFISDQPAAAPRSIIPESNAAHKDIFQTMSTIDSDNPDSFNQQAELDQIVSEYKVNQMTDEMDVSRGEDSSDDTDMSESDSDDFLYERPDSSSSSSDLDDTVYRQQTPIVYDSADGSLDDLCAAKPRSIKPEFHGVGKDIHLAISRLTVKASDLHAKLDQIVLQYKQQLHNIGKNAGILCGPETIIPVRPRANDAFRVSTTRVMIIKNMMRNDFVVKKFTRPPNYVSELNAPADKGSESNIQWIGNMWKATTEVHDPEERMTCCKHLQWYNEALDDFQSRPKMVGNERCLVYFVLPHTEYIQEVPNPKLNELKKHILISFREKTLALAGALVSWMTDTPELNELSPTVFAAKDKGSNIASRNNKKI